MDTERICPNCQKPLGRDVPLGLCPECLIKSGFPTGVESAGTKRPPFVPPTVEELAKLFPQLEILELIGQGGMGAVYKARQPRLNRFVALKILPPSIGSDPAFAERFAREAQALAQLNHPGIVTLYEFGQAGGLHFFMMEFVDGVNLRQLLVKGRIAPREALAIVPQICDALQFAHDQGIVHRDIKPENILLDRRGRVKVADFGLAKIIGGENDPAAGDRPAGSPALTEAGKVVGTPQYMSPEQLAHPADVDHRADIYALGVVFYQMLTGELPGSKIEPPSRKVHIDVRLDEVVLRALEKKPELRYQQVSEVKTIVETIVSSGSTAVPAVPFDAQSNRTAANQAPLVRFLEIVFGITFTSSLAVMLIKISALGFLAFLSFLADLPLPGMHHFLGFSGFSGFFGLIGVAFLVEFAKRRKVVSTVAKSQTLPAVDCPVTMEEWLATIDGGNFANSWETAAEYFQHGVSKAEWISRLEKVRRPLGKVLSRNLASTEFTAAGTRFQATYNTSFDGLLAAVETVTYALQANGEWQAIGYLIRPAGYGEKKAIGWLTSPFASPEVQEIVAHMTPSEKRESLLLGALFGIWNAATWFAPVWGIFFMAKPLNNWKLAAATWAVGILFYPVWRGIMRKAMCSTEWATARGITPASLRRFSSNKQTPRETLACFALFFVGVSAILGTLAFGLMPGTSPFLDWSILAAALLGIVLGIPARRRWSGKSAVVVGCINVAIWLAVLLAWNLFHGRAFYIGQAYFPNGDSVSLTSVKRSDDEIVVRGRYNLISADRAQLALYITTSSTNPVPTDSKQLMQISKGQGTFALIHPHPVPGLPHVTMYSPD